MGLLVFGDEVATGMTGFITALTAGVSSDTLWAEITKAVPFLITIFVVAVGYRLVRRMVNKGSKLKAGI